MPDELNSPLSVSWSSRSRRSGSAAISSPIDVAREIRARNVLLRVEQRLQPDQDLDVGAQLGFDGIVRIGRRRFEAKLSLPRDGPSDDVKGDAGQCQPQEQDQPRDLRLPGRPEVIAAHGHGAG